MEISGDLFQVLIFGLGNDPLTWLVRDRTWSSRSGNTVGDGHGLWQ